MRETIDETLKRRLRKWLGIDKIAHTQEEEVQRLAAVGRIVQNKIEAALVDVENTRADLIRRMDDLSLELAERKKADSGEEKASDKDTVRPGHVPFSLRRQRAQGRGTNMAAYVVPGKPTPKT